MPEILTRLTNPMEAPNAALRCVTLLASIKKHTKASWIARRLSKDTCKQGAEDRESTDEGSAWSVLPYEVREIVLRHLLDSIFDYASAKSQTREEIARSVASLMLVNHEFLSILRVPVLQTRVRIFQQMFEVLVAIYQHHKDPLPPNLRYGYIEEKDMVVVTSFEYVRPGALHPPFRCIDGWSAPLINVLRPKPKRLSTRNKSPRQCRQKYSVESLVMREWYRKSDALRTELRHLDKILPVAHKAYNHFKNRIDASEQGERAMFRRAGLKLADDSVVQDLRSRLASLELSYRFRN